jgi:hypothetical protein
MRGRAAAADYAGPGCPHCAAALDLSRPMTGRQTCASCSRPFEAVRFAAPMRQAAVRPVGEMTGGGTACASHPGNVSTSNCQRCGVFMCGLCEIDADEMKMCPACFDRLSAEGALASTRTSFRDYGRQGAMLAALGLPFMWLGLLIGPIAIYYAIRSLKQLELVGEGKGRLRAVLTILFGVLEAGMSGFLVYSVIRQSNG